MSERFRFYGAVRDFLKKEYELLKERLEGEEEREILERVLNCLLGRLAQNVNPRRKFKLLVEGIAALVFLCDYLQSPEKYELTPKAELHAAELVSKGLLQVWEEKIEESGCQIEFDPESGEYKFSQSDFSLYSIDGFLVEIRGLLPPYLRDQDFSFIFDLNCLSEIDQILRGREENGCSLFELIEEFFMVDPKLIVDLTGMSLSVIVRLREDEFLFSKLFPLSELLDLREWVKERER